MLISPLLGAVSSACAGDKHRGSHFFDVLSRVRSRVARLFRKNVTGVPVRAERSLDYGAVQKGGR